MKILAIIGSPRKGNTSRTVKKIEENHKKITDCDYEYIFLKDLNLSPCRGCFLCISKGETYCPLKDDKDSLVRKIESSDAVILSSPNYGANVSGLMKNFIDRIAYIGHRPHFFKQKFMLLVTSGSYMGVKNTRKALSIAVSGGTIISRLNVFFPPGMDKKNQEKEDEKIRKASEKFAMLLQNGKEIKHPFSYIIWFSVFKASSVFNKENLPADYNYFKDKEYFTDGRMSLFRKLSIAVFTTFFRFMIRKGFI